MDRRFLRYYEEELQFLRDLGGEFAKAHEGIAGRLGLDAFGCADPYVERLLEGCAFLTARVQLKLDGEFRHFTEHLLELVYPDYLAPTPSMLLAQLVPDRQVAVPAEGYVVPRGMRLVSRLGPRMQTRCVFTTAHEVTLWPLEITGLRYLPAAGLAAAGVPRRREVQAGLVLGLRTMGELPMARLALDRLVLHVRGPGARAFRLHEVLLAHTVGLVAKAPGPGGALLMERPGSELVRRHGFAAEEALLPLPPEGFDGYRLLKEYFAFPQRFLFAAVDGLAPALRRAEGTALELVFLLDRIDAELEASLAADDLVLFATPAVNLFDKLCEPVQLDRHLPAQHVVPDRVRPQDFEIHGLSEVTGEGGQGGPQSFAPFYRLDLDLPADRADAFYTTERRPRLLSEKEARRGQGRSTYQGDELFVSLVDGRSAPWRGDLKRLLVRARCTNRDLPLLMPLPPGESHFTIETGAPVARIACLGEPSRPRGSLAAGEPVDARPGQPWGEAAWRLVSHLCLNYLSITEPPNGEGAEALREMLGLYADFAERPVARQLQGVRGIGSRPVIDRLPGGGPITFGRGLELELLLEERWFEGTSAFLLGAVLEQFFRRYVALNTFTRTMVRTVERGEIMRWPARIGQRHLI
ncbi:MAG TPA: type VI secretion system baseplate subunit TssF [Geminicoccaceae bacterium]|nr:type VI secretion system baseplate subunit TssF [Geminicoccaceae bacterium]